MFRLATRINGPIIAIGDVHGQSDELALLLELCGELPDFSQRWVVLLGDLIDRGPDPKGVLDLVVELVRRHPRTTIVAGNHELAMSRALGWTPAGCEAGADLEWLTGYGAEATFSSYGVADGNLEDLTSRLPNLHRELISSLPWCVEHPQYLFVHAGIDPQLPFSLQLKLLKARAQTVGRVPWLTSKRLAQADPPPDCRVTVVSGHLLVPQVQFRGRRILVATTDGLHGALSAVLLPERTAIGLTARRDNSRRKAGGFRRL